MNERIKELVNIAANRNIRTSPAVASDIADWKVIEKFAALVRAEALEEAAKVCESMIGTYLSHERCASAIRGLK